MHSRRSFGSTAQYRILRCAAGSGGEQRSHHPIGSMISRMTIREKIGQMIIAEFSTWNENPEEEGSEAVPVTELTEELRGAIARNRFGGIMVKSENCAGNEQALRLISQMQEANQDTDSTCRIPLLIAVDQEGGAVVRLGEGTKWIGNMALTATGDPENARIAAASIGSELAALGINVDFAPVLDVNNNPANPVIGVRSFSDVPEAAAEYGLCYLKGLQETGTISCLKHFPGHGDVSTDSHTGFPILEKTYEELKECELVPFQAAIDAGADMVMTAHIQYPKIETQTYTSITTGEKVYLPATLSHRILTEILRGDMGFDGVIITDAMEMAAVKDNFDRMDTAVMAIEAGVDLLLIPVPVTDAQSLKEMEDFIAALCEKVEDGTLNEAVVDEAVRRILTMKEKHGLLNTTAADLTEEQISQAAGIPGSPENHELEWQMMQKAATLLKNDQELIPIQAAAGEKVLVLYSLGSRIASADFARERLVKEGLLPEDVTFESMVLGNDTKEDCIQAAKEADYVIGVSTIFSSAERDPAAESGASLAVLDEVLKAAHEAGKKFVFISSYLPYDAARFSDADAIILTYGSTPMRELPKGKESYAVNIPAAVCGIFGEFTFTGSLPVDIPKLDEKYQFTEEILYSRSN